MNNLPQDLIDDAKAAGIIHDPSQLPDSVASALIKHNSLRRARWERERNDAWIIAMATALGLQSGYEIPITPDANTFRKLFSSLREQAGKVQVPGDIEALRNSIMKEMAYLIANPTKWEGWPGTMQFANAAIRAMLASAPTPPQPQEQESPKDFAKWWNDNPLYTKAFQDWWEKFSDAYGHYGDPKAIARAAWDHALAFNAEIPQDQPEAVEPVAWCVANTNPDGPPVLIYGNGYALKPGDKLFTASPSAQAMFNLGLKMARERMIKVLGDSNADMVHYAINPLTLPTDTVVMTRGELEEIASLHCPASSGFEGPETFPDCGKCIVCRTRAIVAQHMPSKDEYPCSTDN